MSRGDTQTPPRESKAYNLARCGLGIGHGMQRWQWTRYQLMLSVGAAVRMQREQLRHSSLRRFEAGWERSAGYLLFSFLSASEDFSADMDSSQPVNSPRNTCSEGRGLLSCPKAAP